MKNENGFEANDFVIRIRPSTIGDEWTGEIDVSMITASDNSLDDESYGQLMHLTRMVCSTIPMMEQDPELGNRVHEWAMTNLDDSPADFTQDNEEVEVTHEGDNVFRLNFGTPTKGSA